MKSHSHHRTLKRPQLPPRVERPQLPPHVERPQLPPHVERPLLPPRVERPLLPPHVERPLLPPRVEKPLLPPARGNGMGKTRDTCLTPRCGRLRRRLSTCGGSSGLSTSTCGVAFQRVVETMPKEAMPKAAKCIVCKKKTDPSRLLMCDEDLCTSQICFSCAGVKDVPSGDWFCGICMDKKLGGGPDDVVKVGSETVMDESTTGKRGQPETFAISSPATQPPSKTGRLSSPKLPSGPEMPSLGGDGTSSGAHVSTIATTSNAFFLQAPNAKKVPPHNYS